MAIGIDENANKVISAMENLIAIPNAYDFDRSLISVDDNNNASDYNSSVIKSGDVYNININQPIDTPDEIARILRTESQYGLIGGVAIE